jgi:hypothetical protein
MRKQNKYSTFIAIMTILLIAGSYASCVKADNYAAPGETFYGTIYDSVTGKPMQLDQNEARIQVLELSWTATRPTPNPDFYANDTGYFYNARLFKGFYNVNIVGPFVPMAPQWPSVIDSSRSLTIQGLVKQDYTVSPILELQWVTPPVYNPADSSISATVTVSHGTANPLYNNGKIVNINFYITGNSAYPGNASYDGRYTTIKNSFPANETIVLNGVVTPNVFAFGGNYIVKSIGKIPPTTGRTWWARVGAYTNTSLPVVGTPFNYTSIQPVTIK